jgi:integrase/recombinase XerC
MSTYVAYIATQTGRGLSRQTIRTYSWYVRHVEDLVGVDPALWTAATVAEVIADWDGLSKSSRQQRGAVIRGLLRHAGRDELITHVPRVGRPRRMPRPAPDAAVTAVWSMPDGAARRGLLLAAYLGLRVAEISALRWQDLDLEAGVAYVRGKGDADRRPPLCAPLLAELRAWDRRDSPWVVVDRRGRPYMPQSLTRTLSTALAPGVTAHMLRHWSATWAYRSSGDLLAVQQYLGHASPATTAGYTLLDDTAVRTALAGLPSPRRPDSTSSMVSSRRC